MRLVDGKGIWSTAVLQLEQKIGYEGGFELWTSYEQFIAFPKMSLSHKTKFLRQILYILGLAEEPTWV